MKILTILIPCFNSSKTILRTIDSLNLKVHHNDIDVLLIDDGSTDDTLLIIKSIQKEFPKSIKIISKKNGNYGSVINEAKNNIKTRFIRTLDSDDTLVTKNIQTFIYELKNMDDDVDLVFTNYYFVNNDTNIKTKNSLTTWFKLTQKTIASSLDKIKKPTKNHITIHSLTFSTNSFNKINDLPENVFYTDSCLIYQIFQNSNKISYIPHLYIYNYFVGNVNQSINIDNIIKNNKDIGLVLDYTIKLGMPGNLSNKRLSWLGGVLRTIIKLNFLSISCNKTLHNDLKKTKVSEIIKQIDDNIKSQKSKYYIFDTSLKLMFYLKIEIISKIIRISHKVLTTKFVKASKNKEINNEIISNNTIA